MQYDGTSYGLFADSFSTILSKNLTYLQPTFPNANSPNDPGYVQAYMTSVQGFILQNALAQLWNSGNANTAGGLGMDILFSTVNNLTRNSLKQSSAAIVITAGPVYSSMVVQVNVSAVGATPPYTIPTGWAVASSLVTPTSPYTYTGTPISINESGVYYVTVTSTDTSTAIPGFAIDSGDPVVGLTYTVTNPASATLGSVSVNTDWYVTASSLGEQSPRYYPASAFTIKEAGTYNINVYSDNVSTAIYASQLNTASSDLGGVILNVTNPLDGMLGTPEETDAQFAARRRYSLNIEGQSYGGLKKAISDLNVPGLQGLAIVGDISDAYISSICQVKVSINYTGSPVVLPSGWTIYGAAAVTSPYSLQTTFTFTASGDYYLPFYSSDISTTVPISNFTTADPPFGTSVTAVDNTVPAMLGINTSLGRRGTIVYLNYPTLPYSYCDLTITVSAIGLAVPYYIPVGWMATGPVTTSPYATTESYAISSIGTYTIRVYSSDNTTVIAPGVFTGGDAVVGLTFTVTNASAAVLGVITPGMFDTNDVYLQNIAQICASYIPEGTQFYGGGDGATVFSTLTKENYYKDVLLTPYQKINISCDMQLVYNLDPSDAGSSSGIFDSSLLSTLQTQIQQLINQYFLSKSSNTYVMYSVKEVEQLIVAKYKGIVALVGNLTNYFSFGNLSPVQTGVIWLKQENGKYYNLDIANFSFKATNKDNYIP